MRRLVATLASILVLSPTGLSLAAGPATTEAVREAGGLVVLELFTSQGCSSCPNAEHVLSQLGLQEQTRAKVVPLAYHVDYWDEGGWHDPFSAREWTERQTAYGLAFGIDNPYTPQLVVNGRAQFNGGDARRALAEIAADLQHPPAASISLATSQDQGARSALTVAVTAVVGQSVPARKLEALVAVFESRLDTPVGGGENSGRTLRNDFVVRRLETVFSIEPTAGTRKAQTVKLKLDSVWNLDHLGVAAFLQDPKSMRIFAAAAARSVR